MSEKPSSNELVTAGPRVPDVLPRPKLHSGRIGISIDRLGIMLATAVYSYSIFYAYVVYQNPNWEYMGFSFRAPSALEVIALALLLGITALGLPKRLESPSSLILMLLYVVVYVPGLVITFCVDGDRLERYLPFASALSLVFFASSLMSTYSRRTRSMHVVYPSKTFVMSMLLIWFLMCFFLVVQYAEVMAIVAFVNVYEQRALGASTGPIMAYIQTYFSSVISPALLAVGLAYRHRMCFAIGVAGCLLMYAINAQKTMLFLPLAMIALHVQMNIWGGILRATWIPVSVFSAITWLAASYWEESVVAGALALFFVNRTIAVPGLTLTQYYEQFSSEGFTFWSHVKGLDLIIPAPQSYAIDPLWPGLGYMLGDRLFGNRDFNMNANLFSGDGIAAAGAIGVLVIGVVFMVFLWILDRVTARWDARFVLLAILPVALALTNGHFFTTLLSFGGLFWLTAFWLMRGARKPLRGGAVAAWRNFS